jgi:hypothetical protein
MATMIALAIFVRSRRSGPGASRTARTRSFQTARHFAILDNVDFFNRILMEFLPGRLAGEHLRVLGGLLDRLGVVRPGGGQDDIWKSTSTSGGTVTEPSPFVGSR